MAPDAYHLFRQATGIESDGTSYSMDTLQTATGDHPAFVTAETAGPGSVWIDGALWLANMALSAPFPSPTWQAHAVKPIAVGTFNVSEETGSISGCDVFWITYFRVESHAQAAPCRNGCIYQFLFVSRQADDPLVNEVIASIALDQKVQTLG